MSSFGGSPGRSFGEAGGVERDSYYRTPAALRSFGRGSATPPKVRTQVPQTSSLLGGAGKSPGYSSLTRTISDYTVTVFGFPQEYKEQILARFRFAEIESENHGSGNWFNISYRREEDMRKALAMNGNVLFDNVMIGVRGRKEEELAEKIVTVQPPEIDDLVVRSQYYRRQTREVPTLWDKFLEHFLNWD